MLPRKPSSSILPTRGVAGGHTGGQLSRHHRWWSNLVAEEDNGECIFSTLQRRDFRSPTRSPKAGERGIPGAFVNQAILMIRSGCQATWKPSPAIFNRSQAFFYHQDLWDW